MQELLEDVVLWSNAVCGFSTFPERR